MNPSLEALGQVVRKRRTDARMSQEGLGKVAGYGAGAGVAISRIESGLTRPTRERFEGIAQALSRTPEQLESEAWEATQKHAKTAASSGGAARMIPTSNEKIKDRIKRIQEEVDRRTAAITARGEAFNDAHDRARDEFFVKFVDIAAGITGAPQPDPDGLGDDDVDSGSAQETARRRLHFASTGIGNVLAGGAGGAAAGAAVGGAVGGAAAYGAFFAAASLGTASTGAAISGLSGVAATNAALAFIGGGSLAAGGAGIAGGTAVLVGLVAAPVLILAAGGLFWMVKRNRKQQQELVEKLNAADADLADTKRGFDALVDILTRASEVLEYIALHAAHALKKWEEQLGALPVPWDAMSREQQQSYQNFIDISGGQVAVATLEVQGVLTSRGEKREDLILLADEMLSQTQKLVESLV